MPKSIMCAEDVKTYADIKVLARKNRTGLEFLKAMFMWGMLTLDEYTKFRGIYLGEDFLKRGGLNA